MTWPSARAVPTAVSGRAVPPVGLSGDAEVVQAGDAEDGMVDAVGFESAVARNLPIIHVGEGVLDAGPDLPMRAVVVLFPTREFLALAAAVRDDQSGALVAAVGDGHRLADGGLGPGF